MSRGIDIASEELDILVSVADNYMALVDATTITLGQGSRGGLRGLDATAVKALITRYRAARADRERL